MKELLFALLLAALCIPCFGAGKNLFGQDSVVIGEHSPIMDLTGHRIENLFPEETSRFFGRGLPVIFEQNPENRYFVEWETKTPADTGFVEVCANCDIPTTNRKAGGFALFGKKAPEDTWTEIFSWTPPPGIYAFEDASRHVVASGKARAKGMRYFRGEVLGNPEESPGGSPVFYGFRAYENNPRKAGAPRAAGDKYAVYVLHDQGQTGYPGMQRFIEGLKERGI